MIYYKLEEKAIAKYEVNFNEKTLLKLKEQIIREECPVIHEELRASFFIPALMEKGFEIRHVKNEGYLFTREIMGGPERDIYLFTYDKYLYTEDVLLINRLLNHDATALDEILTSDGNQKTRRLKISKLIKLTLIKKVTLKNIQELANFWDTEINLKELNRKKILKK